jgi:rhodanese-related sulfurtransferase
MWGREQGHGGGGARAALLALALLLSAGAALAYENITRADAWARIQAGGNLIVLDVREYFEFCGFSEHIENAVCLPWTSGILITDHGVLPQDWDILVYCAAGNRSPNAAAYLEAQGFTSVFNLTSGLNTWSYDTEPCEPAPRVMMSRAGGEILWDILPTDDVQNYDLLRGDLDQIVGGPAEVDLGPTECLAQLSPFTYGVDDAPPPAGDAPIWFYLARQEGMTYGNASDGRLRVAPPPGCD